jgi:drug/metabolite transporter (DMT)-like permease
MMIKYYLAALLGVLLTAVSQVLLKMGARRAGSEAWRLYLNCYTPGAYFILALVTLLNLYAFREVPLKAAVALLPLTLLLVAFFSFWLLRERLTRKQAWGAVLIMLGLTIFSL